MLKVHGGCSIEAVWLMVNAEPRVLTRYLTRTAYSTLTVTIMGEHGMVEPPAPQHIADGVWPAGLPGSLTQMDSLQTSQ